MPPYIYPQYPYPNLTGHYGHHATHGLHAHQGTHANHYYYPSEAAYSTQGNAPAAAPYGYAMQPPTPTTAQTFQGPTVPPALNLPTMAVPKNSADGAKQPLLNFTHPGFIKGALAGAAVAYLATNETVQNAAIKASVKTWLTLQGSLEEVKERLKDAEAEIIADETEA